MERLFKAKKKHSGEWIEGYIAKAKWYLDGKDMFVILPTDLCIYPHCEFSEWEEIDETTICQYTGLTDKNGNKIWENDIVKHNYTLFRHMHPYAEKGSKNYVIKWDNTAVYCGYRYHNARNIFPFKKGTSWNGNDEVIGNIFDNPELLQEDKQ